jgi:aromatic ring hydroxylase
LSITPSFIRRSTATSRPIKSPTTASTWTKETDGGIIVSGAKVVATGSVLTNYTFIAHHGLIPLQDKKFALVLMVPTNAQGVKFLCRTSYEMTSAVMSSPFDQPLSSRLDENDAVFIMDKVFVPWENLFVYGDVEKANNFFPQTGFLPALRRPWVHASCREARLHRGPSVESR